VEESSVEREREVEKKNKQTDCKKDKKGTDVDTNRKNKQDIKSNLTNA